MHRVENMSGPDENRTCGILATHTKLSLQDYIDIEESRFSFEISHPRTDPTG